RRTTSRPAFSTAASSGWERRCGGRSPCPLPLLKRQHQVALRILEARTDAQRVPELPDRISQPPLRCQCDAEVVVHFRGIRREFERRLEFGDRLIELAGLEQNASQVVTGGAISR